MQTLKVGVVGAGMIGDHHARLWAKVPGVTVAGIVEVDQAKARAMADRLKIPAFGSLRELKRRTGAQVASLCVPSALHAKVGLEAVREGMHLFVGKPLDINISRAKELLRAARSKGLRLAVSSQKRWAPGSLKIRELVAAGALGRIFLVRAIVPWYRSQKYYDQGAGRGTYRSDGGGALIIHAIHMVDLALHLTGKEPIWAGASSGTFTHRIEVEDTLVGHLRMSDGTLGQVLAGTSLYPGFADRVEIYGEKGTVHWEGGDLSFAMFNGGKVSDYGTFLTYGKIPFLKKFADGLQVGILGPLREPWKFVRARLKAVDWPLLGRSVSAFDESFLAQLRDAGEFFRTGKGSIVTGRSALRTLAVIEALYRSARTHREERVEPVR
ncbi:MAG TPA: Gfo/Idh/MocA family oxidoreductase [bacterium]|nr:Gfo/Idh/MocA family oxidoreductase [bacterium]